MTKPSGSKRSTFWIRRYGYHVHTPKSSYKQTNCLFRRDRFSFDVLLGLWGVADCAWASGLEWLAAVCSPLLPATLPNALSRPHEDALHTLPTRSRTPNQLRWNMKLALNASLRILIAAGVVALHVTIHLLDGADGLNGIFGGRGQQMGGDSSSRFHHDAHRQRPSL